jgi:hypothetical protein
MLHRERTLLFAAAARVAAQTCCEWIFVMPRRRVAVRRSACFGCGFSIASTPSARAHPRRIDPRAGACLRFRSECKGGAATEKVGPKALRQPCSRLGADSCQGLDRAHVHASVGGAQHGHRYGGKMERRG